MREVDSIGEILELAVAREEEANLLYKDLAKRAKDPTMRIIFEKLADEELEHKAKLELEIMKKCSRALESMQQKEQCPLNRIRTNFW